MLGPDALKPENADETLARLDSMAAIKPKTSQASSQADMQGLSRVMNDAQSLSRPKGPAFGSVHDAAKGLLNDLDEDSSLRPPR